MTTEPEPLEEVSDGELEEIKKKPEFKEAGNQDELWKTFLERRKMGDPRMANEHETGKEEDWGKPGISETYIGSKGKKDEGNE